MYALEKRVPGFLWRRYAVCNSRKPINRVYSGLKDEKFWRVVYIPNSIAEAEKMRAA